MGLYHLYSHNVEIQYKSYFISKATLFTLLTTAMNIILPFIVAYRSRGFWLMSHSFYEQPVVSPTYEYLLVATTLDPSEAIICGEAAGLKLQLDKINDEYCAEIQIQEYDYNGDGKTDMLQFQFAINVIPKHTITSIVIVLGVDLQLQTICELQMQALAIIDRQFAIPPSRFRFYGDIEFYQTSNLPCTKNVIDIIHNTSLFNSHYDREEDIAERILEEYMKRTVITQIKTLFSNSNIGSTDILKININLRVPEMQIRYQPSVLQELKWAWPQYLSLVAIFYWLFNKLKKFVFNKRLLMAWEVVPWKER